MILPKVRDPRLVTIRRGGSLRDADHQQLALWAALCAEHVLPIFERAASGDRRPRQAIEAGRAWARGELRMMRARALGGHAMGAARPLTGAARFAAYAAGQAACVAHVPEHDLGAAAYAIRAAVGDAEPGQEERTRKDECAWQLSQLQPGLRDLVIEDERRHNDICWHVFDKP